MEYLNLHTATLDHEVLATADDVPRSVWLHLMRFCIGQENDGRIVGAKLWPERKWLLLCRITPAAAQGESPLWEWDGNDLVIWGYPTEKQAEVKARREAGRRGGQARTEAKTQAARSNGRSKSQAPTEANAEHSPSKHPTEGNGKEGNGKEGNKGKEGNGKEGKRPALRDAQAYAKTIGLSESEAAKFFDHFEANGWRQGGRTPLRSWQAALRNWARRAGEFKKSSGGGGGGADFDPQKPNAHTGGAEEAV